MKPIKGFENYLIDECGNIFNSKKNYSRRVLGLHTNGYWGVVLCKEGKKYQFLVHRLVYQTFIGELNDGLVINHIDGNKQNNNISNLEQVTQKENCIHNSGRPRKINTPRRIVQMCHSGNVIAEFKNVTEAARSINKPLTAISYCVNGERKTAYGYQWKYKEEAA